MARWPGRDGQGDADGVDFLLLQQAFGEEMPSMETFKSMTALAANSSAVPEPNTFGILAIAGMIVLQRMQRSQTLPKQAPALA